MSQICRSCKKHLPFEKFSKQASCKSGYRKTCKDCHNQYVREVWYKKNSSKQIASSKKWKDNNKNRVLAQRYKCDLEIIEKLLELGKCQICESKENLHIDHCHSSGKVRGILCRSCNIGIGNFEENIERINSAISYLKKHQG
jgi:hypothetical protein